MHVFRKNWTIGIAITLLLHSHLQADVLADIYKKAKDAAQSASGSKPVWVKSRDGVLKQVSPSHIKWMRTYSGDPIKANKHNNEKAPLELPLSNESLIILLKAFEFFPKPELLKRYVNSLDKNDKYRLIRALIVTNAMFVLDAVKIVMGEKTFNDIHSQCLRQEPHACSIQNAGMYMPR